MTNPKGEALQVGFEGLYTTMFVGNPKISLTF